MKFSTPKQASLRTSCMVCMCIVAAISTLTSCQSDPYANLSPELAAATKANIALAGENAAQLETALTQAPDAQKEGMAYLIAYMPVGDRDTLSANFLLTEVDWAYKARETFPWAKALPDSIFYNDVLPYASMDESREPWRAMLWEKLYPLVAGMTDQRAALDTINKQLQYLVGVEYNTKRRKPNQSPSESMEIGMASCSGLSILLTDALRTMGIPSRIAGTPLWVSKEGNHNWSEVWIDGNWYFIEYYPTPALNESWFLERAGKADKSDPVYWIYATSWRPQTDLAFPMVWARKNKNVPGVDVTDFYINLYNAQLAKAASGIPVSVKLFKDQTGGRSSADRVALNIRVKDDKDQIVAVGTTAEPTADMNDYLKLYLPEGQNLKIEFTNAEGKLQSTPIKTDKAQDLELFLK